MISTKEIVDLSEFLKREGFKSSPYQIFAAQQVLLSESVQDAGVGSLVRLSNLLGPIFCHTPEEQEKFKGFYLQWLRQRSVRPHTISITTESEVQKPDRPTFHWRMKLAAAGLLLLPLLTSWFLWQDLRPRVVVGRVLVGSQPASQATVQLGEQTISTDINGTFQFPFQAKDMPLELAVEMKDFLPSRTPIGESLKTNRTWFYLNPIDWSDKISIGDIPLTKEELPTEPPVPDPIDPIQRSPSKLSLEKIVTLTVPPPSWATRIDFLRAGVVLLPILLVTSWFLYRITRRRGLQRQSSRIPPELKQVQVQAGTQHIFPSLSLRSITQRLRQTRFVESTELDVSRTIQHTMNQGGLFTPVYGSKREPGYLAFVDRSTMADHQANLATQLVKDLAQGYVLVQQYEFDEQPTMLRKVDSLRNSPVFAGSATAVATAVEVVPLEEVLAKFPSRRLLCFADPMTCFDPLTGKLQPWVETLELWEERFLFTTNPSQQWGLAERILSRRGFQVIPLSALGLQLFSSLLEQHNPSRKNGTRTLLPPVSLYERMPERWLERHPPSPEMVTRLLDELHQDLGTNGMLWLAACAAYPEIHWGLTLEWGVRLFGHGSITEILLPKLTRLIWFRQAFMPDWFRKALYAQLTSQEADQISQELGEILSAVNPENREGLQLNIATRQRKKPEPISHIGPMKNWFLKLRRKLTLQAMGEAAEAGSPMGDFVMLQYLSGKQGKALTPYAPEALLKFLFPKGQPWLGFRPLAMVGAAAGLSLALGWWLDPVPVPLPSPIQALALSGNGKTLAAGLEDGRLVEWDWRSKQVKQEYSGYPFPVSTVAGSNDGTLLVAGYQDGSIHVLDRDVEKETQVLKGHPSAVTSIAFWPTPEKFPRLVSVSAKKYAVWNNFNLGQTEPFGYVDITALAFSPAGDWAAGGNSLGEIFTSGAADSDLNHFFNLDLSFGSSPQDAGALKHLAWDPTGSFLVSQHADGTLRIWENNSRLELAKVEGPVGEVSGLSWPTPEEAFLTISGPDGPEIWRIRIPIQLLQQELARHDQEKAAFLRAREKAKQVEQASPADKAEAKRRGDMEALFKLESLVRKPSRHLISAVSRGETPIAIPEIGHGIFTYVFLQGIGEGLAEGNRDGFITTDELFQFILHNVVAESFKGGVFQTPSSWNLSGGGGEFVFENPRKHPAVGSKVSKPVVSSLGKAFALSIGVNEYRNGLPALKYAVKDARAVAALLQSRGFTVENLLDADATRMNILERIQKALSIKANKYDRVLIYFSGHGKNFEITDGKQRGYLLSSDTDPDEIPTTGINLTEIVDMVKRSETKHVLIVLDSGGIATIGQATPAKKKPVGLVQPADQGLPRSESQRSVVLDEPKTSQPVPQQAQQQLEEAQQIEEPPSQVEELPSKITGKDGAVMGLVPAGEFTMGARDDEKQLLQKMNPGAGPAHQVFLDAFYLDQFEVTTSLYTKFLRATNRDLPKFWPDGVLKEHGQKPAVRVTWDDAQAYCQHYGKRLPSEAEWEKAARGTDQRLYPWGNEPPNQALANFGKCCDFNDYGVLTDVGSFERGKSPYRIYDMAGNAWEWVADWFDRNLYEKRVKTKEQPLNNPRGPAKGDQKVLRGGSWADGAMVLQSMIRHRALPSDSNLNGFRCAQGAP